VADSSGVPLSGAAGQRRVLAFLSLLAAAGHGGLSREKLAALLWPEADTERARHSVTQVLYASRRALRIDDLFEVGSDIRLNEARLVSDVQELEAALEAGELERAVSLYHGPFLDGFFVSGSAEFEQWSSTQRGRFEDRVVNALGQLASRAAQGEDLGGEIEWRKKLAGLRPLDSAAAAGLMMALARAGDRAGAIRHGEVHGYLLREEIGIEPDAAVTELAERLRGATDWSGGGVAGPVDERPSTRIVPARELDTTEVLPPAAVAGQAHASEIGPIPDSAEALVASVSFPGEPGVVSAPQPQERVGWRTPDPLRRLFSVLAHHRLSVGMGALLLGVAAVYLSSSRRQPPPASPPADARLRQTVVVAPFRVAGASAALAYLREGVVELLSTRLADDSISRSVDAGAVLSAWRKSGLERDVDLPRDSVVRLAASLGAARVVIGSVVGSRSHAILSASVVAVPSNTVAGTATVEGPADSLTTLVDRLAARLLVQAAGEDGALAEQTTASLPALRAFLAGQAAYRENDYDTALPSYRRALKLDSTFALAALQLVRSSDRLQRDDDRAWALALAWSARDALSERDRALLFALTGPRFPAPSTVAEQLAAWERPARLTPDRAESWFELGARLFYDGAIIGLPDAPARAATALRRALEIDSGYTPVRRLLVQLAVGDAAEAATGGLPAPAALRDSTGQLAPFVRWRVAAARGDEAMLRRLRATMPRLGRANLRAIVQASQFDATALPDARRASGLLWARAVRLVDQLDAAEAAYALGLNEGHLRETASASDKIAELQPGSRAPLRLRVLDALYGDGAQLAGELAAQRLARGITISPAGLFVLQPGQDDDACVLAQWRLSNGDTTGAASFAQALRDVRGATPARLVTTPPGLCAILLEASLAVAAGWPDARAVLARLDSLALTPATSGDAIAYAPILIARLHDRLGDAAAARSAVRRRAYMVGWPRYLATALRDEGRYAAAAGEPAAARFAYERYLVLRARPDSALAGEVQRVRLALAGLPRLPQ
jgi:DNA-binding SARP family transcriptional activator/tetratricopeptide (TPR) repeat protein